MNREPCLGGQYRPSRTGLRSLKRQAGAEMVETIVTMLFFFIILLLIIDFAILLFDRGTLAEASRIGARQASLYWIYPDDTSANTACPYDDLHPVQTVCMQEAMIVTAVDLYRNNILLKFNTIQGP